MGGAPGHAAKPLPRTLRRWRPGHEAGCSRAAAAADGELADKDSRWAFCFRTYEMADRFLGTTGQRDAACSHDGPAPVVS